MLPQLHKLIEEHAFNALPALETLAYDGWLIRLSGGGPKRANSVNILTESSLPLQDKFKYCETLFAEHALPLIFRLTNHPGSHVVDAFLEGEGLAEIDPSMVMTLDLENTGAEICETLLAGTWYEAMRALDRGSEARKRKHVELLKMLTLPVVYGCQSIDKTPVAIGLAVIDGVYAGLFDIVTATAQLRKGHARKLCLGLLKQSHNFGAKIAYLQVVADNHAAISLYESLGFKICYRYWYRMRLSEIS